MNNTVRSLIIQFDNEIKDFEVPLLRGSVNAAVGGDADILFHNHDGDNFRYSTPLVQYKRDHKKACIVCLQAGTEAIGQFFSAQNFCFHLGEREVEMQIESIRPRTTNVQVWDTEFRYSLRRWLPLNSANYAAYMAMDSMSDRIALLERILTGNILSFAKGLGIHFDRQMSCRIQEIFPPRTTRVKGTKVMMFDLIFKSNVSLPHLVGLGKHASIGYGIVTTIKQQEISK